jgi:hypothetical protein
MGKEFFEVGVQSSSESKHIKCELFFTKKNDV